MIVAVKIKGAANGVTIKTGNSYSITTIHAHTLAHYTATVLAAYYTIHLEPQWQSQMR